MISLFLSFVYNVGLFVLIIIDRRVDKDGYGYFKNKQMLVYQIAVLTGKRSSMIINL